MSYVDEYPDDAKLVRWCLAVAFGSLGIGGLFGMIQALHRSGIYRGIVSSTDYYTVLTAHGVVLGLVFTTFFIAGLFSWAMSRSLGRELPNPRLKRLWFGLMLGGSLLALGTVVAGLLGIGGISADVLFTFYAPMKAHPAFYAGLALLVVGSWLAGANYFLAFREWRADHPDERIPLQTFMVLTTFLMWYLSSIGVALEILLFLLPWSMGLIAEVDPLLTRSLFWYFGHAVVYFWLLPAYLLWYTVLPKLSGGRLISDPLARVVFVLFLLLSTPTGFHHQYLDPGIPSEFKAVAMVNTMFLLLPSLLTAFTVVASMELGARQRGVRGWWNWLRGLPWDEPAFAGMALAGLMFAAGGFSGMVNAGMNSNYLVHNTAWLPGHFHLTVGTATALTAMAGGYWLVPQVTGKRLRGRTAAMVQPYLWFFGMTLMSNALHRAGLSGVPRRTAEPEFNQFNIGFEGVVGGMAEMRLQIAAGGVLLFVSLSLFLYSMALTWWGERGGQLAVNGDIPEPLSGSEHAPLVLDNLRLWLAIAILLVVLAYAFPLYGMVADGVLQPGSPPITV